MPEAVGALGGAGLEGQVRGGGAVGQGDVEADEVHGYHEDGLDEEGGGEMCAEPVEYSWLGISMC